MLAALVAWSLFALGLLLANAAARHAHFTGADGLIGADGVLGADQLQYLAWVRDAATHGLTSDLFTLEPNGHVYLQPLFAISGLLVRAGLSPALAYLLWKPVAIVVVFASALAWCRRAFGDQVPARTAAVVLSLFLYSPVPALLSWTQFGAGTFRFHTYLLADELLVAGKLWGYLPSAFGIALVAVSLLALDRALDGRPEPRPSRAGAPGGRWSRRAASLSAGAALLASWLHPWQGITLILIFAGLAAWRRLDGWPALAAAALGAALPLGYYYVLSHTDSAWRLAARLEVTGHLPALALLAGLGPLAAIAACGARRPRGQPFEQALLLWVGACFVTYFVNDTFPTHALQGLSVPFGVMAVRAWQRLRLGAALGLLAISLVTVPGLAFLARKFVLTADSSLVQYYLPSSDARALRWVADHAPAGGVLAPTPFAAVIPSQTGRAVWVGHGYWSRDYAGRARQVDRLFGGRMRPAAARDLVRSTGASVLVADCGHRADLARELAGEVASTRRFGCARVWVLRAAGAHAG